MVDLGVNIDHVATLRNVRGSHYPCLKRAAEICLESGAKHITIHLREDRRHILDSDLELLRNFPVNLEVEPVSNMIDIALQYKPKYCCLVPENRKEITTEKGLNINDDFNSIKQYVGLLNDSGIITSAFVDPNYISLDMAKSAGFQVVELHTGHYAQSLNEKELDNLYQVASYANQIGLYCHAGHGLNYTSAEMVSKIPNIAELNIGHFLISEAVFVGLRNAILNMINIINNNNK